MVLTERSERSANTLDVGVQQIKSVTVFVSWLTVTRAVKRKVEKDGNWSISEPSPGRCDVE